MLRVEVLTNAFIHDADQIETMLNFKDDVLILVGNIVSGDDRSVLYKLSDICSQKYTTTYFIPGEYEYRSNKYTISQIKKFLEQVGRTHSNFHVLMDDFHVNQNLGVMIYGTSLWKYYNRHVPPMDSSIRIHRNNPMTPAMCKAMKINCVQGIKKFLESTMRTNYDIIVICGMPPNNLVHDNYFYKSSEMDELIKSSYKATWIFGGYDKRVYHIN